MTGIIHRRAALQSFAASTAIWLGMFFSQAARAEETAPAGGLSEIVVTAQKRKENLQATPIAITAVTGAALTERGARDISNLQQMTPSLVFNTTAPVSGASSAAIVFIRGVGQTDFQLTTDPGVGTYVDGVYEARSIGGVLDVLDLDHVEVLRGPQGTLFGRNTIGGAISLVSRRPADHFTVRGELTGGSRDLVDGYVAIDAPISDSVHSKVVGSYKSQDGYVHGLTDGRTLGDTNHGSIRLTVEAKLSPDLLATFTADYTHLREASAADKLVGISVVAPGGTTRTDYVYDRATGGVSTQAVTVPPGAPSLTFLQDLVAPYDQRYITTGLDTTYSGGPDGTRLDIWGGSLTLDWTTPLGEAKSISAVRETSGSFARDADGSPLIVTDQKDSNYLQRQFSQELQLAGATADKRFNYATGLYYFDEIGHDYLQVFLPALFGNVYNYAIVANQSYAAYAQGTAKVTPALSITAGVRYTRDEKRYSVPVGGGGLLNGGAAPFGPAGTFTPFFPPGSYKRTFDNVSFKGGADYTLGDGTLLYASYSQGYKSGGFDTRYLVPTTSVVSFDPEKLKTVEVGAKWQSTDRRLRLNLAAYTSSYTNIQLSVYQSGAPITRNAGSARIKGVEAEATARPWEKLEAGVGAGYIDAYYTQVAALDPSIASDEQVVEGDALPKTPKWTVNAHLAYTQPVNEHGDIKARVDWAYSSWVANDAINSKFIVQPAYHLVNASLGYESDGGRWSLTAYVKNLFNTRYIQSGDSNYSIGFHEANFNPPREIGGRLGFKF